MENLIIFEQIRVIGSKIARARTAAKQGNIEHRNWILEGAIELVDLILKHEFRIGHVREMTIFHDVVQDIIDGTGLYDCSLESLEEYCLPFSLLVRKNN